jgi:hypothetical protein
MQRLHDKNRKLWDNTVSLTIKENVYIPWYGRYGKPTSRSKIKIYIHFQFRQGVRSCFENLRLYGVKEHLTQVNLNIESCSGGLRPIKDTETRIFTVYLLNVFLSPLSNGIQFCGGGRQTRAWVWGGGEGEQMEEVWSEAWARDHSKGEVGHTLLPIASVSPFTPPSLHLSTMKMEAAVCSETLMTYLFYI